jgi:signal transduction histidine kinase
MLAQVERLGRLVSQLLDLSRLESGTVPLARQWFAVEPMLEHAIGDSRLRSPDVRVRVDVQAGLTLFADAERLHQVVSNLVENALRHSPPGGVVTVGARAVRGGVCFEVDDDGPGIPDAEAERVFERFYRADSARSSDDGGAGLGLAIARWIVDLHGGDIHSERRDPHGCRMVAVVPGPTRPVDTTPRAPRDGHPLATANQEGT